MIHQATYFHVKHLGGGGSYNNMYDWIKIWYLMGNLYNDVDFVDIKILSLTDKITSSTLSISIVTTSERYFKWGKWQRKEILGRSRCEIILILKWCIGVKSRFITFISYKIYTCSNCSPLCLSSSISPFYSQFKLIF